MSLLINQQTITKAPMLPSSFSKKLFLKLCKSLRIGQLHLIDGDEEWSLGQQENESTHNASVRVLNNRFYAQVIRGGLNGAAESFMEGDWETDDLVALVQLLLINRETMAAMDSPFSAFFRLTSKVAHFFNRNSLEGSKRNISAHYDLGNEFFELFLDQNLMYSSAVFPTGQESLEEASLIKMERICQKLDLTPDDHLLEIGTGWGGMAIYAAQQYGCKVTTTTLSKEQYAEAEKRVKAAGLEDKITLLLQDYRELAGKYDKLVSIEMVEAVGHLYLDGYFECIQNLLKTDGLAVLQAITIDDQQYDQALKEVDFIKRYIFPGSFIPCVTVLTNSAAKQGLRVFNLEDIGASYAHTLQQWRLRFSQQYPAVKQQGFDERFIRMWHFYLCYCEGGFRERAISTVQLILTPQKNRRDQWLPGHAGNRSC
jgi:cyclopropane-fatty-acyl-phospholipid synthase